MMNNDDSLDRVDEWKDKFKSQLESHIEQVSSLDPEKTVSEIKEEWFINKLATLMVGSELLGNKIRELEERLAKD